MGSAVLSGYRLHFQRPNDDVFNARGRNETWANANNQIYHENIRDWEKI